MAEKLGDPTARAAGRLTLDPRSHVDPIMTIVLPLVLILAGSPIILGGAKPVPINTQNFQDPKKDIALTAAAGPLTNLAIAGFFVLILKTAEYFSLQSFITTFSDIAVFSVLINIFLGLFNLLPIPSLDGFKVVGGLLPDSHTNSWYSLERFGMGFMVITIFFFGDIANNFLYSAVSTLVHFLL